VKLGMPRNFFQSRSLKTRVTAFTLVVFLIGTWSMAFYASRLLHDDMQSLLGDQQFSTASLLAEEVEREVDDRLRGLEKLAGRIPPAMLNDTAVLQAFLEQQSIALGMFNGGTWISSQDGIVIASNLPKLIGTNYADREYMIAVLREGKSTISKPITGKVLKDPIFVMAVPLRDARGKVIGALAGVNDLSKPNFLDSVTANTYGKTGGYLIVAPQYRLIVTASDKSRVMEALPAAGYNPVIDRFIDGYEGSAVLVNPFGVEVLASAKSVPAAGWYVASVLPTAEAFAPIHAMEQRMLLATLFLTLVVGGLTWWMTWRMLRHQLSPLLATTKTLATLSATALPPLPLPITSQDEIGELLGGFNHLLESVAVRSQGLVREIAERKRIEEDLRLERDRIQLYLDTALALMVALDSAGKITMINRAALNLLGYAENDLLGRHWFETCLPQPEGMETVFPVFQRIIAGDVESIEEYENFIQCRDGSQHLILWRNAYTTDTAGLITGTLSTGTDITESRRIASEREHAVRRIEALMKNASDCVVVLNAERRIIAISDSCLSTYGYTREELLAMAGADLRAPDVRKELPQRLQELTEKISLTYQTRHCRKDGSRFPVDIGATMIDIDGKRYFQFTIRDISQSVRQREAMEKELAATSNRLSELSHHLVEVQEDTRRRLAGELHDRTSPNLAAIQINLGIIATALPQDSPELAERLADTRALIEDTDNSIREISADLRSPLLDYAGLAAAVEAYAARFTQRNGIPVEFGCANGATRLAPALESLLFRIFQEALTNILKHARARSIKIMLNLDDSKVALTVADDGVGFDLERLGAGAPRVGLGLLNMREMAEFAGGTLFIESHPGRGTRIDVRIQP
jgi:PAS domain S-box-containing protein